MMLMHRKRSFCLMHLKLSLLMHLKLRFIMFIACQLSERREAPLLGWIVQTVESHTLVKDGQATPTSSAQTTGRGLFWFIFKT